MPVLLLCSSSQISTGDFLSPGKVITKVGGQDDKGQFKVRNNKGERGEQTEVHLSVVMPR